MPLNNGFKVLEANSPLSIPGLLLWYSDSKRTNFEFNTGDQVDKWLDLSGNKYHATQVISVNQPSYINGKLTFDGVSRFLDCPLTYDWNSKNFTIYTVQENDTTTNNFRAVFSNRFGVASNWFIIGHDFANDKFVMEYTSGNLIFNNPAFADSLQSAFIYTLIKETTPSTTVRINNGSEQISLAAYNNGGLTNNVKIGFWFTANQYWIGKISEIIIIGRKVTTLENAQIINYLANKRGIGVL